MKRLFRVMAVAVFLVFWTRAEIIVAPNDRETQSGNTFQITGFDGPTSFQSVYGSRNFSGPVLIHSLAFRADEGSGGASFEAVIPRVVIQMSTYSGTLQSFNFSSYDANKGADDMTAFDGSIHWITTDLPGGGPNPFDLKIQFSRPFLYDPSAGALLINCRPFGPFSGGVIADLHAHGDLGIGWSGTGSGAGIGNLPTQFEVTPVPEPAVLSLLLVAVPFILANRGRR